MKQLKKFKETFVNESKYVVKRLVDYEISNKRIDSQQNTNDDHGTIMTRTFQLCKNKTGEMNFEKNR